jgi:hypothetical protein
MPKKVKTPYDNLFHMFQKAYTENKYLDVSKLASTGTGSRLYDLCQTKCNDKLRTKRHVQGLNIVSNNYQAYKQAISILKQNPAYSGLDAYVAEFAKITTGTIHSPKKSPGGVKSPKYSNMPVIGLPTNLLSGQSGSSLMKSPRNKNVVSSGSMPSSPTFSVFGSPQMKTQSPQPVFRTQSPLVKSGTPLLQSSSPRLSPTSQLKQFQNLTPAVPNKWGTRTAI